MLLRFLFLMFILCLELNAQAKCSGCNDLGPGYITSGTDNQVACFDGAGTTLADCDCTFTMDGTNIVWQCGTDATAGFAFNDKDGNIALGIDTLSNPPRVGIGTAAPTEALDITGNIISSGFISAATEFRITTTQTLSFTGAVLEIAKAAIWNGVSLFVGGDEYFQVGGSQTTLCQDTTATTGDTLCVDKAGAGETGNIREWQDNSGNVLASIDKDGKISAEPGGNIGSCKKYTKTFTDLTDADTEQDPVLFNLPARGKVWAVNIKHSTAFSGGGLSAMTVSVGDSTSPTLYALAFDAFQAVADDKFQDGPSAPNFLSSTWAARDVFARFTSTGANMNAVTAGSVDVHVCWLVLPL